MLTSIQALHLRQRIQTHLADSLVLNAYGLMLIRILGMGVGFLFWGVVARMLPAERVGLATGTVSAATLVAGLAQLGLGYGVIKYWVEDKARNGILTIALLTSLTAAIAFAGLYLLGVPVWSPALLSLRENLYAEAIFIVLAVGITLSQLLNWIFLATNKLSFAVIKNSVQAIGSMVLLAVISLYMTNAADIDHTTVIMAYMLAVVLSTGMALVGFLPLAQPGYKMAFAVPLAKMRQFFRFSLLNFGADQFHRAPDTVLPLIVLYHLGPTYGAYFFIVWNLGRSITSITGSVAESLFAKGVNMVASTRQQTWSALKFGLLITSAMAICIIAGGMQILGLYGGDYGEQGFYLLCLVALAAIPSILIEVYISALRVENRMGQVSMLRILNNGLGIACTYAFMNYYGFTGAGIGWFASQMLFAMILLLVWKSRDWMAE